MPHFKHKPMKRHFLFPRFFALWLTLGLVLPQPAFALRQINAGSEEGRVDDELRARFLGTSDAVPAPAAGTEQAEPGWVREFRDGAQRYRQAADKVGRVGWIARVFNRLSGSGRRYNAKLIAGNQKIRDGIPMPDEVERALDARDAAAIEEAVWVFSRRVSGYVKENAPPPLDTISLKEVNEIPAQEFIQGTRRTELLMRRAQLGPRRFQFDLDVRSTLAEVTDLQDILIDVLMTSVRLRAHLASVRIRDYERARSGYDRFPSLQGVSEQFLSDAGLDVNQAIARLQEAKEILLKLKGDFLGKDSPFYREGRRWDFVAHGIAEELRRELLRITNQALGQLHAAGTEQQAPRALQAFFDGQRSFASPGSLRAVFYGPRNEDFSRLPEEWVVRAYLNGMVRIEGARLVAAPEVSEALGAYENRRLSDGKFDPQKVLLAQILSRNPEGEAQDEAAAAAAGAEDEEIEVLGLPQRVSNGFRRYGIATVPALAVIPRNYVEYILRQFQTGRHWERTRTRLMERIDRGLRMRGFTLPASPKGAPQENIESLGLSGKVWALLRRDYGIETVSALTSFTLPEIEEFENIGKVYVTEIKKAVTNYGLTFASEQSQAGAEEMKQILEQAANSPEAVIGLRRTVADQLSRLSPGVRAMLKIDLDKSNGFGKRLAPEDPFLYAVALWIQETRDRNPDYFLLLERIVERRNLSSPRIPAISVPQLFLHSLSGNFDNASDVQIERFVRFSQELHLLPGEYGIRALALELYFSGNHAKRQMPEPEDLRSTTPNAIRAIEMLKDPKRWESIALDRQPVLALFLKRGLLNYLSAVSPRHVEFMKSRTEWIRLQRVVNENMREISEWAGEVEAMETMPTQFWLLLRWRQYHSYYVDQIPAAQRDGKPVSFEEILMHLYLPEYAGLLDRFPVIHHSKNWHPWRVVRQDLPSEDPWATFQESLRSWQTAPDAAGAEEPNPPSLAPGFGEGKFQANWIGGGVPYTVQSGDQIVRGDVRYETPKGVGLAPDQVKVGTKIKVRQIKTVTIPLDALGRFALHDLTFQIVPMGGDQQDFRPPESSASRGVEVAPMAKRFLLQVWLEGKWEDLDLVHLEDGVPVIIGRELFPKSLSLVTQFDLEGKVGRPVGDNHYGKIFEGFRGNDLEQRVVVSWTENELQKTAYLPRLALSTYVSQGDLRTKRRAGWNINNGKFVPAYLQAGHLQIEIMGNEVVFSDLGSTNPTRIEVNREWAKRQEDQSQKGGVSFAGTLHQGILDSMASVGSGSSAESPAEDQSVIEGAVSDLLQRMQNQMIVIDHLKNEVPINPEKPVRFPFEEPFKIFFRINGKPQVAVEFLVRDGQLHARAPSSEWKPVGNNYLAQEWIPVAGQDRFEADASRVNEGYRVMYSPSTNTVVVLNHSPYQIRVAPAAGAEEGATLAAGLTALTTYVANPDVIGTLRTLAESGKTGDVTSDFPELVQLAREAGFEGIAEILRTAGDGEAVLGVPAQYAAQGIPIFVKKKYENQIKANLERIEKARIIRFVTQMDEAFLVISDSARGVNPGQMLLRINDQTVSQVTGHLLQELQLQGRLKAGSVVMLYQPLKDSALVFA